MCTFTTVFNTGIHNFYLGTDCDNLYRSDNEAVINNASCLSLSRPQVLAAQVCPGLLWSADVSLHGECGILEESLRRNDQPFLQIP